MVEVNRTELSTAVGEGFLPATAERVWRLLGVLRELQSRPKTSGKFTLKGGTALNVFHFPQPPRLSVDLDLMVTGFPRAAPHSAERLEVVELARKVGRDLGYDVLEEPAEAGCTLTWSYRNTLGSADRIKLDLDLLNRMTLLPTVSKDGPVLFGADDVNFPVVSEPELLGQKLTAVAYRAAPRDLFDMYIMLMAGWHRKPGARAMYLAYSFLQDQDWYRLSYPVQLNVPYKPNQLAEVLRGETPAPTLDRIREGARDALERVTPPFTSATDKEQDLRRQLLRGDLAAFADIVGEPDPARRKELAEHPGLHWRLQQAGRLGAQKRSK